MYEHCDGSERNLKVVESYFATGYRGHAYKDSRSDTPNKPDVLTCFAELNIYINKDFFLFLQPVVLHLLNSFVQELQFKSGITGQRALE
jgi:hypothetical protein